MRLTLSKEAVRPSSRRYTPLSVTRLEFLTTIFSTIRLIARQRRERGWKTIER